jgi:epoxide hydrolase-like predicted phosphatase
MGENIKYVIFDAGGVLIDDENITAFNKVNEKLGKRVMIPTRFRYLNTLSGKMSEADYFNFLSGRSGIPAIKIRNARTSVFLRFLRIRPDVLKITEKLRKKGYKTAIISNTSFASKRLNIKRGLYFGFSPVILSCDVHCLKPFPEIYEIAMKRIRAKTQECVYVDNWKRGMIVPRKMGMHTIHFENASQLAYELKKLGVKI